MNMFRSPRRLALGIFCACALGVAGPVTAGHHADTDNTITVSGTAAASMEADLVSIRFGVETRETTAEETLSANARQMQAVIRSLQDADIAEDEISTSRFNIQAVYDTQQDPQTGNRTQVMTGYRASNIIVVETDKLDRVAAIIDSAVGAGANRVDGVQFLLSPESMSDARERLIGQAVLNARSRAELALAPLGRAITGVRSVSLTDHAVPMPMAAETARFKVAQSAPTQIFASDQQVRTMVEVTFLIGESRP